ncbi:MAG: hypothetical protein HUU15_06980 [Candidatus Brocadiae bacterium]|nr:hypothetical protein [Candidatus Brocadiia bacterium]
MAEPRILYVDVDERSAHLSGTAFHHAGHIHAPIAYVLGFAFLRNQACTVKVEMVRPKNRPPGEDPAVWAAMVEEVKAAVRFHISHKGSTKVKGGKVSTREHME